MMACGLAEIDFMSNIAVTHPRQSDAAVAQVRSQCPAVYALMICHQHVHDIVYDLLVSNKS